LDPYYAQPDPFVPGNKHWKDLWSSYVYKNLALDNHQRRFYIPISGAYPGLLVGIMANVDLLRKAGVGREVPTEWNDWMKQLATLKAKGYNAVAGEASHSGAEAASWPLWSELWPAYMGHVYSKVVPGGNPATTSATQLQIAKAVKRGVISTADPMFQALLRQVKRYMSYWIPGWQTADIESLWTQGKLAERQAGIWDLLSELSDPNRHFKLSMNIPPIPTTKSDPRVMNPLGRLPTGLAARTARVGPGNGNVFALIARSIQRDHNEAAAIKWLQYISAPQQDEFIVNEHPDNIPATLGTHMAPIYEALNNVPVPDYKSLGSTYPFGMTAEATPDMERELAVWVTGHESDKTFFAHIEHIIMQSATTYLANAK
jgi:raffinose/stachyose/melibiose transport system substrate-binding protein